MIPSEQQQRQRRRQQIALESNARVVVACCCCVLQKAQIAEETDEQVRLRRTVKRLQEEMHDRDELLEVCVCGVRHTACVVSAIDW